MVTLFFKQFTMEHSLCGNVKPIQKLHKHDIPLSNTAFEVTNPQVLCKCKLTFFQRFTMKYPPCGNVKST